MTGRSHLSGDPSHSGGLLLRVHRAEGRTDQIYVAPGLKIGRSEANNIVLEDEAVDRIHAQVEILNNTSVCLCCQEPMGTITVDGRSVRELELGPGVAFRIGVTEFECVSGKAIPSGCMASGSPHCPFCRCTDVLLVSQEGHRCPACGKLLIPVPFGREGSPPLLVPVEYGIYQAHHFVAAGGMGLVLKGSLLKDQQAVAIKLLRPDDWAGQSATDRFQKEIKLMARICDPHVVRLLNYGTSGELGFLIMEWVEGRSLRQIIAESRSVGSSIDFEEALKWFLQVCKGLDAIHGAGVIHRDIKPANILIGKDGRARIADLGVAKEMKGAEAGLTTTGEMPGTFVYMAPEQINAPETVDQRADLYSLGATFYELLTGATAFGAWRPASAVNRTVPTAFDPVIARLLAPAPAERYSSARELIDAVAAVVNVRIAAADEEGSPIAITGNGSPAKQSADDEELTPTFFWTRRSTTVSTQQPSARGGPDPAGRVKKVDEKTHAWPTLSRIVISIFFIFQLIRGCSGGASPTSQQPAPATSNQQ